MRGSRLVVVFVVLAVFLVGGGVLVARSTMGGGADVTVKLDIRGGQMSPAHPSVHLGDHVTMTVTADRDEEIHLHDYDIAFEAKAGRPVTHTFTADKGGAHDIEIEDTGTSLGSLQVG